MDPTAVVNLKPDPQQRHRTAQLEVDWVLASVVDAQLVPNRVGRDEPSRNELRQDAS
jgi:hypothetical protein